MAVSMGTVAVGLFAGPAAAQTTSSASRTDSTSDTESQTLQTVIVTGTSQARADLRTPLVATSISSDRLTLLASNSAADVLTTVPALKAEGGGGEVAANIFVAGLPSGGQYQFTPLEFNGMPVISSMGLNSSAPDVYYRPDLGVERLEFVRGGVSNLFGGGGIGGVINFIDSQLCYPPISSFHGLLQAGAQELDRLAAARSRRFADLPGDQQDQILGEVPRRRMGAYSGARFFEILLALTLEGFFSDPIYGGNRDGVGWKMIGHVPRSPGARCAYPGIS